MKTIINSNATGYIGSMIRETEDPIAEMEVMFNAIKPTPEDSKTMTAYNVEDCDCDNPSDEMSIMFNSNTDEE